MQNKTALLCAGGTGGHLFPAEALAHELKARGWSVQLVTDKRAARFASDFPADDVHRVDAATFGSKNPVAILRSLMTIWRGYRQASTLLERVKPAVVIGFGGYPTIPPLFAASRKKIPTMIHEQNAVMGRANKALASRVDAIAGGFLPQGGGPFPQKTVVTGNPVRPAVLDAMKLGYKAPGEGEPFHLLVFGGSQGARFFSEAVPEAVSQLPENLRQHLKIVQQARTEDEAEVRAHYARLGVEAEISPFFSNMAERIAAAHFVISRSGASTVSEISAIGRPALLVPYPYALDHDQAANAAALAQAGGAEIVAQAELDAQKLSAFIASKMQEPQALQRIAASARSSGKPDAAKRLADLAEQVAQGRASEEFRKDTTS